MSITILGWVITPSITVRRRVLGVMKPDTKAWGFMEQGMALTELIEASEDVLDQVKHPHWYQLEQSIETLEASIAYAKGKQGVAA